MNRTVADVTNAQIDALLAFLPAFEAPGFAAASLESTSPNDFSHYDYAPVVTDFVQALYDHGWVWAGFDWPSWTEHARAYVKAPENLATADVRTIRKLLTTHAREERFCEGHLASMFERGHIVAVLRRLGELRQSSEVVSS